METEKTPFTPFQPPLPPMFEGTVAPAQTAAAPAAKRKRASGKKKPAVKANPAPKPNADPKPKAPLRARRKKPAADRHAVDAVKPAKPPRKARGAPKGKRAPKFELQTILRVAAGLKPGDQKLFETMLGELSAIPKAGRRRVLIALGQVLG